MNTIGVTLLTFFVAIVLFIYYWSTKRLNYWKTRQIPYIPGMPLFGNFYNVVLGYNSMADEYREFYKRTAGLDYFGILIGSNPVLMPRDPDLIHRILVKDYQFFNERGFHINKNDVIGNNIFFLRNPDWRALRLKLVPVFSASKLRCMSDLIEKTGNDLVQHVHDLRQEILSTRELMSDAFTDITIKAICGIELHSIQKPNQFHVAMQQSIFAPDFRSQIRMMLNFSSPFWATRVNIFSSRVEEYFRAMTKETMRARKVKGGSYRRNDFVQLLMEAAKSEETQPPEQRIITEEHMIASIFIFIAAGFETSVSTTCNVLNFLAYHPHIQSKAREEVRALMTENDGKLNYDGVQKLKYLQQIISETLRISSTVSTIFRECMQDYPIPGTKDVIRKGEYVHIPYYGLHMDPKYWDDPDKFDPDRFAEENLHLIHPGTYIPFGDGPKICIGKRFSLVQIKIILSKMLLNYEISPCEKSTKKSETVKNALLSTPSSMFWLKYKKIVDA